MPKPGDLVRLTCLDSLERSGIELRCPYARVIHTVHNQKSGFFHYVVEACEPPRLHRGRDRFERDPRERWLYVGGDEFEPIR